MLFRSRGYNVVHYGGNDLRAAIIVPNSLHYFPIPSLTDRDMASILIGSEANVISSIYMDGLITVDITKPLQMVADYSKHAKCRMLIGCDSNAHSPAWGDKSLDGRGVAVEEFLLNNPIKVDNVGDTPTFFAKIGETIIDLTISSMEIGRAHV